MKQYHIFHATGRDRFSEVAIQPRIYAGYVEATSLNEAYALSQNIDSAWNEVQPCRSTSVGDVIQDDDTFYMVCGVGFEALGISPEPNDVPEPNEEENYYTLAR